MGYSAIKFRGLPATVIMVVLCYLTTDAQRQSAPQGSCDSMSRKIFFANARAIWRKMDSHTDLTLPDAKMMMRIYNTIEISKIREDSLNYDHVLEAVVKLFNSYYYNIVKVKYDLKNGKGGTLYLSKLDIYIQPGTIIGSQDFYEVY